MIKELILEAYKIIDRECNSDCENCKYDKEIKGTNCIAICDAVTSLTLKYEH